MTPASIIRDTQSDGVKLALSTAGTIKVSGDSTAVSRWLAVIREHKADLLVELQQPTNDTLTPAEESVIRAWLAHIEEDDPAIIAEVIEKCRADPVARAYFLHRAEEVPKASDDDRIRCHDCARLSVSGVCIANLPGVARGYRPIRDRPRRCEGYTPGPDDPDRRHGRERWPRLMQEGDE